jgi:sugar phosphate permease
MATSPPQVEKMTHGRIFLAAILFVTLLVSYLDRVNVSVLIADPGFLEDMGIAAQPTQMGMLMSVFLLAYGVSNIVLAPIGRMLGPRKAMSMSIMLWAVAVALGGFAGSFVAMVATRVLLGVGEGLHWPMQSAFVKNWFPPRERARANAAWLMGIMIGPMISMPILSSLVSSHGWRSSFFVLALLSLLPVCLIWFFTSDHPGESTLVGARERAHIEDGLRAEALQEIPSAGFAQPTFLRDHRFWLITLAFLSSACIFWGTMAWLPSYLKVVRSFTWSQMSGLAAMPYVLGAVNVFAFGLLGDYLGRKAVLPVVALLGAAACLYAGANAEDNLLSAYYLSGSIGFLGVGLASYWTVLQSIVPASAVGSAAGVMNGVASLGSALMPMVVGYLIERTGSYSAGLTFLVGMGILGATSAAVLMMKKV